MTHTPPTHTLLALTASALLFTATGCLNATPEQDRQDNTTPSESIGGKGDIYGEDDRRETYESDPGSLERRLASASAVLTFAQGLQSVEAGDGGAGQGYRFRDKVQSLQQSVGLCEDQRFTDQPRLGFCSATLVAPDLVATSGHCLGRHGAGPDQARCENVRVVFDFAYTSEPDDPMGDLQPLPEKDVYSCKDVEAMGWRGRRGNEPHQDWALVRLDREVAGRQPVPVAGDVPAAGRDVLQIGHPSGIPQKLAPGVVTNRTDFEMAAHFAGNTFTYRSDLLGGNSGGGVFDLQTETLAGIPTLYSGKNYVSASDRQCKVPGVCGRNTECPSPPGAYATEKILDYLSADHPDLVDELQVVDLPDDATHTFDVGTTTRDGGTTTHDGRTLPHDGGPTTRDGTTTRDLSSGGSDNHDSGFGG